MSAAEVYERYVKSLPPKERLRLIALTADGMSESTEKPHSIMELHGLGKEIWEGVDAQEYVNQLRDEWDRDKA